MLLDPGWLRGFVGAMPGAPLGAVPGGWGAPWVLYVDFWRRCPRPSIASGCAFPPVPLEYAIWL